MNEICICFTMDTNTKTFFELCISTGAAEVAANIKTYLLRCMTNEGLGVQYVIQLRQNRGKIGVCLDSGQQVIITTLLFHHSCCLLGQNANLLMAVLGRAENFCF